MSLYVPFFDMLQLIVYGLLLFLTLLAVFDIIRLCTYDNEASKRRLRMWSGMYLLALS